MRDLNKKLNSLDSNLWDSFRVNLGNSLVYGLGHRLRVSLSDSLWASFEHSLRDSLNQTAQSVKSAQSAEGVSNA